MKCDICQQEYSLSNITIKSKNNYICDNCYEMYQRNIFYCDFHHKYEVGTFTIVDYVEQICNEAIENEEVKIFQCSITNQYHKLTPNTSWAYIEGELKPVSDAFFDLKLYLDIHGGVGKAEPFKDKNGHYYHYNGYALYDTGDGYDVHYK